MAAAPSVSRAGGLLALRTAVATAFATFSEATPFYQAPPYSWSCVSRLVIGVRCMRMGISIM
jgi:hypothetical protein